MEAMHPSAHAGALGQLIFVIHPNKVAKAHFVKIQKKYKYTHKDTNTCEKTDENIDENTDRIHPKVIWDEGGRMTVSSGQSPLCLPPQSKCASTSHTFNCMMMMMMMMVMIKTMTHF